MLTQLSRLNLQADGRYANDQELQFLEDYLNSADQRINTYEKVRENEVSILLEVEAKMHELNKDNCLFYMGPHEIELCRQDRQKVILHTSAAMLINDLDRLRDGLLIWMKTIIRGVGHKDFVRTHYPIMQEVIKAYLTPEEAAFILPALQLDCTILGA